MLVCLLVLSASAEAAPPDLTDPGVLVDTTYTYNLGPTGARGWIYSTGNEWLFTPEGLTTESRQIMVTAIETGSPAAGNLRVNDVILGASGTAAAPVAFTSDARKNLGRAIGEAEKTANAGALKLKVWRDGAELPAPVLLTLQVMGSYSTTAPATCPKSTAIITKACTLLASHPINSGYTEGNAVIGLALLACAAPGDAYYATVQSKVQTYARSLASQNLNLTIPVNQMVAWPWGYNNVFLSEYYLATGDRQVLPAIRELTATCATGQSLFGTYGHGMAWSKSDGSSTHGYVPPYGALNQAGETVNLGIMLGRKALAAAGDATLDPEIDPAITRARNYFAYFAGKGAVPYGHSPPEDLHDDNGKNGLATLLMALQDQADMSIEAQYFAKSCTAAYSLREMGHCGPYWARLWQPLGVNIGGPTAMATYFQQIQWELDLARRWDGGFAYHGPTGATAGATGLGSDSDTACFLLTYATALKKLHITGKGQSASNYIAAADVTEAITDGVHSLRTDLDAMTSDQLVTALGTWSPQKRNWAAAELATRADASTKLATLLAMAADLTNVNARKGACQAFERLKPTAALSVLNNRLTDSDYHVRYYAACALKAMGSAAQPVLANMLTTIVSSAQPVEPVNWNDPYQMAHMALGGAVFEGQLGSSVSGVSTSQLYPAITTMARSLGRGTMGDTFRNALSLANVQALAPVITAGALDNHTICEAGLANACVSVLAKYNIDEGIPAAMTFLNQEYGRAWPTDPNTCQTALKKYGSTAGATLPALGYWNGNGVDLAATIAAIQTDRSAHTLSYFKTIGTCTASPTSVALPLGSSLLSAAATDLDGNGAALVYTWSKLRGAGSVTFSTNGTTTSNQTLASFDTPGNYIIRLGVSDGVLDPNKYGPVTRDLTLTVVADTNRPPLAANQHVTTALNTATAITLAASDADGDALTYTVVNSPASGLLSGTAPHLTYTPAAGFTGTISFTFKANDGALDSGTATVTISVGASDNITPLANNQWVSTAEDTAKAITLTGNDADAGTALTYIVAAGPAHGALSGSAPALTYTPAANYAGTDSFTFSVNDGTATSGTATVSITVTAVNDAPLAIAQSLGTPESTAIPITLTGTDPEGYAIIYQLTGSPTHGTLSGVVPNLTYTPTTLYNGTDSLTFTVTDSEGVVSAAAMVSIAVSAVNQAPVALNRSLPVAVGTVTAIVLDSSDADNNPLTYTVLSQPLHGTLSGTAPNLIYTPALGYNSRDSFTFKVNDGTVDSSIATVYFSMGVITAQVHTECYLWPGGVPSPWPDVTRLTPDATRFDADLNIGNTEWPTYFEDHFSSRHTGYVKVATAGNYNFILGADDNTKLWIDETLVIEQTFPNSVTSPLLHLTAGYHSVRLEFVETYGENHFTLYWKGPGINQQVVPASVFYHCVGSTSPLEPANLSATPLDGAVALAWSASPFATGYTLQRALTSGGPYTALPDVLATTSYRDTSVSNGTTYYYVVTATGAGGTSFASNEASTTPVPAPVTLNLDYHPAAGIAMNATASNALTERGSASRVAPLDYDGVNAAATAVHFWNAGNDGTTALTSMKNSEGVTTPIGVSAVLAVHGSSSSLASGLGGAKLLKGGVTLGQTNFPSYKPLFKLSGLSTSHIYQLALASQTGTTNTSISYRVGPLQQSASDGGAATDWRNGLNYALLEGLIPNAAGEIHVQAMLDSSSASLNGWQLLDKGVRTAGANSFATIDTCSFGALGAATINDNSITLTVPYGTAIGALTPTFVSATGAAITPSTAQNFASPVTYRVTAENGTVYQDYRVTLSVAPDVTFTATAPALAAAATGAEILSTGTLVAANHGGSTAVAPVTLANGLTFGISAEHLTSGWGGSHQRTDTDAHGKVPLMDGSTPFGKLMRSYLWSSSTYYYLDIPGLTPGHRYRLQLLSPVPANCKVAVEDAAAVTWAGSVPSLLTATWSAGDSVANVILTRTGGEIDFHGYALHDVTPGFQPAPGGLMATAGVGQIALSWDTAPGATRYTVKRSTTTGGPYATISTATGTTYLDASLSNDIRYYYVVSATTGLGETPNSTQASALVAPPPAPPLAPTNLIATPGNNMVGLTWIAASGASGYIVKRSLTSGGPYAMLGSSGVTGYADTSASNGTTYYYVVSATNSAGEGEDSGEANATPISQPAMTTLTSSPNIAGPYGTAVAFTATVAAAASGTITFRDGSTVLGTATLNAGQATYTTSTLAMGSHSVTASYGGDASFSPSDSGLLAYAVTAKAVTITGVTAGDKVYDGTTTAILTGGAVSGAVSGETVTVIAGSGSFASASVGTWPVTASGFALGGTHAGNYLLAAQPSVPSATITSAAGVTFVTVPMNVTAAGTGAQILNTGTLIEANHFGATTPATSLTLANGLTFGGSTASLIRPNGPNFQAEWEYNGTQTYQTGWGHNASNNRGYTITNTAFDNLMDHAWWIAYSGSRSDMQIAGLVVGHRYRLQLISENPQDGTVTVEGSPATTWSGPNTVFSAVWTAQDTTLNMQLARKVVNRLTGAGQGGEIVFQGYALHDVTSLTVPPAPTHLVASPESNAVGLSWNAASGATGYKVKRATVSGGPYTTLGSPATARYTDASALNGTTYYYVVSATNSSWEGPDSSQVSALPALLVSSTELTASPDPTATYGTAVTFTATVTTGATGTVTFYDGAMVLDTGTLSGGQATFTCSTLVAGSHSITATYTGNATYAVSPSAPLSYVITPAMATVTLSDLAHTYDGSPKNATATTVPAGRTVIFTYDGAATAPSAVGSYAVVATVSDTNYTGTASDTLIIGSESITAWRAAHFTPVEIAAGLAADSVDADGDGLINRTEYILGTAPRAFTPQALALAPATGNALTLSFVARATSGAGYGGRTRRYAVETSSDLANPKSWQPVTGYSAIMGGEQTSNIVGAGQTVTVTLPQADSIMFYRLNVSLD
jgi:fibronectin type 3 domain-containing protein